MTTFAEGMASVREAFADSLLPDLATVRRRDAAGAWQAVGDGAPIPCRLAPVLGGHDRYSDAAASVGADVVIRFRHDADVRLRDRVTINGRACEVRLVAPVVRVHVTALASLEGAG